MKLGTVTFFARDVDALAGFYTAALGLSPTVDDPPRYREVGAGGANIGFAAQAAYQTLCLEDEANPTGLRNILTFALPDANGMTDAVLRAVGCGAAVVRSPYSTHFGSMMAVLRDPEGNVFRLNAPLNADRPA
ncbi:MAG: glyoxalase [Sphingobium sp.]|nr:MAG: glyoxalase [Sphingobium sp.]